MLSDEEQRSPSPRFLCQRVGCALGQVRRQQLISFRIRISEDTLEKSYVMLTATFSTKHCCKHFIEWLIRLTLGTTR